MRVRILWEVLQVGNLIASPKHTVVEDGEYARVTTEYAWWYRSVVRFAFWLCSVGDAVRQRYWTFVLDCAILLTRLADRLYLHAWSQVDAGLDDGG